MEYTPEPMTLRIESKPFTNQGMKRENNEDWVAGFEPSDPREIEVSGYLYIVADGVGGASKGERASQYAAQKVLYEYFKHPEASPDERLAVLIRKAGNDIYEHALETGSPRMATTMVAAVIRGDRLTIANVGDSRAYLIRSGSALQISQDHNLASELVRNGTMTPEEAKHSKTHNKLLRSLGGEPDVDVDVFPPIQLVPGDLILLCTDGLTRYAEAEVIASLASQGSIEQIGETMIQFANQSGGADNITLYVIKVYGDAEETRKTHHHAPQPVDWDMVQTQAEAPTIRVRRPNRFTQKQKIMFGGLIGILAIVILVGSLWINAINKDASSLMDASPESTVQLSEPAQVSTSTSMPETNEQVAPPQPVPDVGIASEVTATQPLATELPGVCVHQIQSSETITSIFNDLISATGPNTFELSQLKSQYTNCNIQELRCYGSVEEIINTDLIQAGNYLQVPITDASDCTSIANNYWVTVP